MFNQLAVQPYEYVEESGFFDVARYDLMERDVFTAKRAARFIGSVCVTESVHVVEETEDIQNESLLCAVRGAAAGNPESLRMLYINAHTAALEATYKAGHVMEVRCELDDGAITQHGQTMQSIQSNALKFAGSSIAMKRRIEAETLNSFRIEDAIQAGELEDRYMLTFSLFPDDMTKTEAETAGFFVNSMTAAIQATTQEAEEIVIQSAFVAGVNTNKSQSQHMPARHDIEAVRKLYELFGHDISGMSVTEVLATPLSIPKRLMENGVVDVVKLFDSFAAHSVNGAATELFFGQNRPAQDYVEFLDVCRNREKHIRNKVEEIVAETIKNVDLLKTPQDAIEELYTQVRKYVLEHAVENRNIDISIFGPEAAYSIEQARMYAEAGNTQLFEMEMRNVNQKAKVGMCGMGANGSDDPNQKLLDRLNGRNNSPESSNQENSPESADSKEGKIRCYKCREVVNKRDVVKEKTWCCPKCEYEVDICTGEVKNQGRQKIESKQLEQPTTSIFAKILAKAA